MAKLFGALLGAATTLYATADVHGIDVSTPVTLSDALCQRKQHNITFGSARAWHSYGGFDPNCLVTAQSWWDADFDDVSLYMFPCALKDAAGQVAQLMSNISGNVRYSRVWLDIETNTSPGCGWSKDVATNCAWLQELVQAAGSAGMPIGIYASFYMWTSLMTDSSTPNGCNINPASGEPYPLWYAHYDNKTTFQDFVPFGGWTQPSLKQYWDTNTVCGVGVDDNWAPNPLPPA